MAGLRIVIELRRDVTPEVILNSLYKYTQLQSSYGMNMVCLVDNRPVAITLHDALDVYIKHQLNVITRRTEFDLKKDLDRIHIIEGLLIAHDNIDEVIHLIKNTKDGTEKEKLMSRFGLDDVQAQAILDMRLQRLSGMNYGKLVDEKTFLLSEVAEFESILNDPNKKNEILIQEMLEIKDKYNDERHSEIALDAQINISNEDLITRENVIVTVTNKGYVKRMKQSEYQAQHRGGTGMSGMKTHSDDEVSMLVPAFSHDFLLFFTNLGRVYAQKTYLIPEGTRTSKGTPLVNVFEFKDGETLATLATVKSLDDPNLNLCFVTRKGIIKRTKLEDFKNIRTSGIIAINLDENDELFKVFITDGNKSIILGSSNGKAIKFKESDVRCIGRSGAGVRGMLLPDNEKIIGASAIDSDDTQVLAITSHGYGKRSLASEYRLQQRGGSGVKTVNVTEKNGNLVMLASVTDDNDLIITTNKGTVIRMHVSDISISGRNTQGVILVKIRDNETIANIAVVAKEDEIEEETKEEASLAATNTEE